MIFVGVDPYRFIEEKDLMVKQLLVLAAEEALDTMEKRDHSLAIDIATQVSKLFGS